jgi:hypothetical protein
VVVKSASVTGDTTASFSMADATVRPRLILPDRQSLFPSLDVLASECPFGGVGELAAHRHRILGDPGNAVHRIRHVHPVPVQRDTGADRLVAEVDLHQLALYGTDFGSRRPALPACCRAG